MSQNYIKLKEKLLELFMLDQPELDFGIYRIMNSKRQEIVKFLDNDLLPQVKAAFAQYKDADKSKIESDIQKAIQQAQELGVDPETSPKVKELRAKITESVDLAGLEDEVYSDLYNFFRRYYKEGDFLSLRRYKEGVYAIPYEGEEVKLYWANHDQYYIKTSEYLRDYTFNLPNGKKVHFKLTEADIEKDNRKANGNQERLFVLADSDFAAEENGQLIIRFAYIPCEKGTTQKSLIEQAVKKVLEANGIDNWLGQLSVKVPTEKNPDRTLLEKHLNDYTARNTFDYFIHKDLGGFLRRELDFYIKNEIMHLDDVENETISQVEQYLSKIKIIRTIAFKVINFVEQLENFQKKLWLKKKFVVETNYCITLDRIPEKLYPEIAANDAQREEWVKLFAIDEIKGDKGDLLTGNSPAYSKKLSVEFLKANLYLVMDTRFFSEEFKHKLLACFDNLEDQFNGLLIQSDNFQAIGLLLVKYNESLKSIYIDPPYNTDASSILYKNDYKDASWLTLMENRLRLASGLLLNDGIICVAIDDEEVSGLRFILSQIFDKEIGIVPVRSNPAGRKTSGRLAPAHEYALFFGKSEKSIPGSLVKTEKGLSRYPQQDEKSRFAWANFIRSGTGDTRQDRPTMFYPIYVNSKDKIRVPDMNWDNQSDEYAILEKPLEDEAIVYPMGMKGANKIEKRWQRGYERVSEADEFRVRRTPEGEISIDFKTRMDDDSLPTTWWDNKLYASANYGAAELKDLFGEKPFDFAKSRYLVEDCLRTCGLESDTSVVLDFFAGSGTTGHAVIDLNREDGGNRKYVLVEMGRYFDTVVKPRIQKAIYSIIWKGGKPQRIPEYIKSLNKTISDLKKELVGLKGIQDKEEYDFKAQRVKGEIEKCQQQIIIVEKQLQEGNEYFGVSHCFKYIRLESYEDSLNNLILKRTAQQENLLAGNAEFRESYMLGYMLDTEAAASAPLLNIDAFKDPFNYKLNITTGSVGETKPVNIDLIETFNYLLGLRVKHIDTIRGFRVIEGHNPKDEKVLIIWRNTEEKSNQDLEAFFLKQHYNTLDMEFDLIYVNGDNNLENLKKDEDTWKVRLIEEEFKRLMFDVQEV